MKKFAVIAAFLMLLASCQNKTAKINSNENNVNSDSIETCHTVVSDDSLVTATWYDTGEGGTAPDIDCVVKFKTTDGKQHEEHRPLLKLAHPNDDYSHREVRKIVNIDDENGNRSYVFFLYGKVDSNVYSHDIVAFEIAGDSLRPLYSYNID